MVMTVKRRKGEARKSVTILLKSVTDWARVFLEPISGEQEPGLQALIRFL
jgi:hypothetical protein